MRTYAKRDGSDWILNGTKVFITNGWMCDAVVVVTVTDREAKAAAHGISLFLVEDGMKGFQKGRKLEKIGLKAQVLRTSVSISRLHILRQVVQTSESVSSFKGHGRAVL